MITYIKNILLYLFSKILIFLYLIFNFFTRLYSYYKKLKFYYYNNRIDNCRLLLDTDEIVQYSGKLNWDNMDKNVKCLEVEYFYNNCRYKIIYEYPLPIIYPLDFKRICRISLLESDMYNDVIKYYSGPNRDFYQCQCKQRLKWIFIFNNIENDNIKLLTNHLDNVIIQKDDLIIF